MKRGALYRPVLLTAAIAVTLLAIAGPPAFGYMQAMRPSVQVRSAGSPLAEIPFTLLYDHIVLPVSINNSPQMNALLDTGMPMKGLMLLDHDVARKLDLEYSGTITLGGGGDATPRTAEVARRASLSFSGFGFPGQQVFVLKESDFADDWPAAAILGTTFFDHAVEIDFSASVIRLYESVDDLPEDPGYPLDLTFTMGIPVVEAGITAGDEEMLPVTLIADTGVNAPLILFAYSDDEIDVPGDAVQTLTGVLSEGLTGEVSGKIGRVAGLNS